jgi:uncharacterized 2Fe-2S/4Fe-4S cluster protein (DUF4445 family)
MPQLTFLPLGASLRVEPGTSLLDAARRAGAALSAECGGKGTCGGCLVLLESGKAAGDFADFLPAEAVREGYVLACRAVAGESDMVVRLSAEPGAGPDLAPGQFAAGCLRQVLPVAELTPLVTILGVGVAEPRPMDGLGDFERLARAIAAATGADRVHCPVEILQTLPQALRLAKHAPACALHLSGECAAGVEGAGRADIVALGNLPPRALGLAVDIGTTSVAVELIDLGSGGVLAHDACYNAQIERGADIISRIGYAARPGGLAELRALVLKTVTCLAAGCLDHAGARPDAVLAASISGNTTMTHLALGIDPEFVRLDPYTPAVLDPGVRLAGEIGLEIHPLAPVLLSPAVGSYLGGDILSGLLLTPLAAGAPEPRLFIDIGTNGEAVLGGADYLFGCACSAGPAFEGGGLSRGMRAQAGAIEAVRLDPETGAAALTVIGGGKPLGVCGSGAIDAVAGLFRAGLLDAAGRLVARPDQPRVASDGRKSRFILARPEASADGRELALTEPDIENIIRAKAAIYSGCQVLLNQAGIDFTDLAEVIVAGGFGHYLNVEDAVAIGLLPDLPREKFRFIGNASLAGSSLTLLSRRHRRLRADLAARLTYLDLSLDPTFMDAYTAALFLPHTERERFPSVK